MIDDEQYIIVGMIGGDTSVRSNRLAVMSAVTDLLELNEPTPPSNTYEVGDNTYNSTADAFRALASNFCTHQDEIPFIPPWWEVHKPEPRLRLKATAVTSVQSIRRRFDWRAAPSWHARRWRRRPDSLTDDGSGFSDHP